MSADSDARALTEQIRHAEAALLDATQRRDALLIDCVVNERWTHDVAAEVFGVSRQRVGQLIRRYRAAHPVRDLTPAERAWRAEQEYAAAKHAQDLRCEAASGGNAAERRAFYGSQHESPADQTETRIGLREWRELRSQGRVEEVA